MQIINDWDYFKKYYPEEVYTIEEAREYASNELLIKGVGADYWAFEVALFNSEIMGQIVKYVGISVYGHAYPLSKEQYEEYKKEIENERN